MSRYRIYTVCIFAFAVFISVWVSDAASRAAVIRKHRNCGQDTLMVVKNNHRGVQDTLNALQDTVVKKSVSDTSAKEKKYVAWRDTVVFLRDSVGKTIDSAGIPMVDKWATKVLRNSLDTLYQSYWKMDTVSLPLMDSVLMEYYDSISSRLPDKRDIKEAERRIKKEYRDSVIKNTPRILETFVLPDSLYYKRILMWSHDQNTNEIDLQQIDTSFNYHYFENPVYKNDVDATYLGTIGSATLTNNYFKREKLREAPFFEPYLPYSYTPETAPFYNTKSPYTELAYWGNPFINKAREESNIKVLSTQNITPALNMTLMYQRFGSNGMLVNEKTDNRTFLIGFNFIGKKYEMHSGYMGQNVKRTENGGLKDEFWVLDTIVDTKTIDVNLKKASNFLKRRSFFLTQSLAIPFNFFRKDADSLSLGQGTVAYLGHSGEFSRYYKKYEDLIKEDETAGRDFYFNQFNLNDTRSYDSLGTTRIENKFFIKLQPYANDAILSKINAGIGYQMLGLYAFSPDFYVTGNKTEWQHNAYLYGGASGVFRKYLKWDAFGRYDFLGYNINDFSLGGNIRLSVYPVDEGIHFNGHVETSLKRPAWFENNVCMNHHKWNNDFKKVSESRLEANLDIPKYKLQAFFGYALIDNIIYYDTLSSVQQHNSPIHVMSAYLQKNFKVWAFHFDNRVLFEVSSAEDILALPKFSVNLRYYVEFNLIKDVLTMQLGSNAIFNTKYYMPNYSPDLGVFYNQGRKKYGNNPYLDAFVNLQWKRACIFLKYTNAAKGWPNSGYFSAYHYIRPEQTIKFGIFWPFYVK